MKKFIKSFAYAFAGLAYAFKTQLNFKIHSLAAIVAAALGLYVNLNAQEWIWITVAIAFVMITELLNTAMEFLVDLVSPQWQFKAGRVKDVAAAAVLIAAAMALLIGLFIFVPKLIYYKCCIKHVE